MSGGREPHHATLPGAEGPLWRRCGRLELALHTWPDPPGPAEGAWWEDRLRWVRGIGPYREARLKARGFSTLGALLAHPTYGSAAGEVLEQVRRRDVAALRRRGARDPELSRLFGSGEAVVLDVETLGLAPVFPVFLAGLAWREEGGWAYLQLLALHPDHEGQLLRALEEAVQGRFQAVVTYNGRSFDLPFLAMRRRFHGFDPPWPWPAAVTLDLLAEARRRLKPIAGSARLGEVAARVLPGPWGQGVSSDEVPACYQRFLQTGDERLLELLLAHNRDDLRALVAVWGWLCGAPEGLTASRVCQPEAVGRGHA